MGRYTRAYTGTLAIVCVGSMAVAVHANERASKLGELEASADRWQGWDVNEHGRDQRTFARYAEVARRYRTLAREVEASQRSLRREIAATSALHRTVVDGTPLLTYVHVRKVVPVAAAPVVGAAPTTTATTPRQATPAGQTPLTATPPQKPGAKPGTTTPAAPAQGSPPAAGTPTAPATPASPSAPTSPTAPPQGTTPGAPPTTTTSPGVTTPTTPTISPPTNTALPTIVGTPQSSKSVSATAGSWTGAPTSFTYQWQRCDASGAGCVVVGAGASYTCVPADIDSTLRVAVQATNSAGSAVAVSAASPKTKPS